VSLRGPLGFKVAGRTIFERREKWVVEGAQCDRGKMKVGPFGNLYVGVDSRYTCSIIHQKCAMQPGYGEDWEKGHTQGQIINSIRLVNLKKGGCGKALGARLVFVLLCLPTSST